MHVVGVEEGIDGRVEMREGDSEEHDPAGCRAVLTERLHAVDGVQWKPADHEEQHDDTETLSSLHFPPVRMSHLQDQGMMSRRQ